MYNSVTYACHSHSLTLSLSLTKGVVDTRAHKIF